MLPSQEISDQSTNTEKASMQIRFGTMLEIEPRKLDQTLALPPFFKQISVSVGNSTTNFRPDSCLATPLLLETKTTVQRQEISDQPPVSECARKQRCADIPPIVIPTYEEISASLVIKPAAKCAKWRGCDKREAQIPRKLNISDFHLKPAEFFRWKKGDVVGLANRNQIFPVDS